MHAHPYDLEHRTGRVFEADAQERVRLGLPPLSAVGAADIAHRACRMAGAAPMNVYFVLAALRSRMVQEQRHALAQEFLRRCEAAQAGRPIPLPANRQHRAPPPQPATVVPFGARR